MEGGLPPDLEDLKSTPVRGEKFKIAIFVMKWKIKSSGIERYRASTGNPIEELG